MNMFHVRTEDINWISVLCRVRVLYIQSSFWINA